MRASVGRVRMVLTEKALQAIDTARVALGTIWPTMKERSGSEKLSSDVERLAQLFESDQLYSQISTAETCAKSIVARTLQPIRRCTIGEQLFAEAARRHPV